MSCTIHNRTLLEERDTFRNCLPCRDTLKRNLMFTKKVRENYRNKTQLPVDNDVNVMRIIERLCSIPNDSKCCSYVWRFRRVHELHGIAVDCVAKKLCIDTRHSSFDVELTNISRLDDWMANNMDANFHRAFDTCWHEDFGSQVGHIDSRTERWSRSVRRSHSVDSVHHDVVPAIFCSIVSASMSVNTPVAWEKGRHASRTWEMSGAIEESEIGKH